MNYEQQLIYKQQQLQERIKWWEGCHNVLVVLGGVSLMILVGIVLCELVTSSPWDKVSNGMSFQEVRELLRYPRDFCRYKQNNNWWELWEWSNYDAEAAWRKGQISPHTLLAYLEYSVETKTVVFCNGYVVDKERHKGIDHHYGWKE